MFEKPLATLLQKIFDLQSVTFDRPGDSEEQDKIFVMVSRAAVKVTEGKQTARVRGRIAVYAESEKMPFGYFSRCIARANKDLTKDLFFFDLEESADTYRGLDLRSMSFEFFYRSQYDPEQGEINQLNLTVEVQSE